MILREESEQIDTPDTITLAIFHHEHVLLLQRNPDAYPGYVDPFGKYWELIGGHIKEGEQPIDAAYREIEEEIGYSDLTLEDFDILTFNCHGVQALNYIYITRIAEEVPVVLSNEHVAYRWTPIVEATEMKLAAKHTQILCYLTQIEIAGLRVWQL